jgi:small subunit ribosomal protein S2
VLEGKAAAPQMAASEKDEFVELDAQGNPVTKESAGRERDDRRRPAPRKPAAKRPAGRRGPPPPRGGRPEQRTEEAAPSGESEAAE